MITGRNLWELIEARAAASGDAEMAVDENGRQLTFADYRDWCERAAAGCPGPGPRRGRRRVVAAADLVRVDGAGRGARPPRRRPRTRSCPSTASGRSASSPGRPAPSCSSCPSVFRRLRLRGHGRDIVAGDGRRPRRAGVPTSRCPKATRRPCRRPRPRPTTRRPAGALALLHVGHHGRPQGRPAHRRLHRRRRRGHGRPLPGVTEADRDALVFPFTHIGGITWLFTSLQFGTVNIFVEAFDPATTVPVPGRRRRHPGRRRHAVPHGVPGGPAGGRPDPIFPDVRAFPGGGAPKPPALHYEMKEELGGVGICSGYGLTEAPILTMVDQRRPRR